MATSLKLTLITIFTILLVKGFNIEAEDVQQHPCRGEGLFVLLGCQTFILKDRPKVPPSGDCCKFVERNGMKCACESISKVAESLISMEKLLFVAQSCGQPLPPGTRCGGYKVPPAWNFLGRKLEQ